MKSKTSFAYDIFRMIPMQYDNSGVRERRGAIKLQDIVIRNVLNWQVSMYDAL